MEGGGSDDPVRVPGFDSEREFGANDDFAYFVPAVKFVHDYFVGFYNILTSSLPLTLSPPISTVFVPEALRHSITKDTRDHTKESVFSSFYSLSYSAFTLLAQIVYQTSYALISHDLQIIPVLQHQVQFVYLMYCVYYGVEHYMLSLPANVEEVPGRALRLCFTRAMNKLGERIASNVETLTPFQMRNIVIPTGANVIEVKYHAEDNIDEHMGCPFDEKRSYTMSVEVTVHTFEMLPVVSKGFREVYKQERLRGDPLADLLILPERKTTESSLSSPLADQTPRLAACS